MDNTVKYAIFIVALLFVSVIFAALLFRGSKRRMRELDERQTELLRLYSNVEELADTFTAEAEDTMNALRALIAEYDRLLKTPPPMPEPQIAEDDLSQIELEEVVYIPSKRAAKPQPAFDAVVGGGDAPRSGRRERVIELKAEGLNANEIARELGITRNEVDLILTLT